jgi:type I restriction enzyme, S subunit
MEIEQMFDVDDLPEGWASATVDDVCSHITDGTHKTPTYTTNGVRFLSTANLAPFKPGFDFSQYERFVSTSDHKELVRRSKPERGDVLVSKCGTIGRSKEVDVSYPFSIFVGLALLKPSRNLFATKYLEVLFNSPQMQSQFDNLSPGSTRRTLTLAGLKSAQIPVPPIAEQERIVKHAESLLARTGSINRRLSQLPAILKRFRQAVLSAA